MSGAGSDALRGKPGGRPTQEPGPDKISVGFEKPTTRDRLYTHKVKTVLAPPSHPIPLPGTLLDQHFPTTSPSEPRPAHSPPRSHTAPAPAPTHAPLSPREIKTVLASSPLPIPYPSPGPIRTTASPFSSPLPCSTRACTTTRTQRSQRPHPQPWQTDVDEPKCRHGKIKTELSPDWPVRCQFVFSMTIVRAASHERSLSLTHTHTQPRRRQPR